MTITGVTAAAGQPPVVEYTLADDDGNPVDISDLDSSSSGNPRFILGWIETGLPGNLTRYQSYTVRSVNGADYDDPATGLPVPPALPAADQVSNDSGGSTVTVAPGSFEYTFGTALPAVIDTTATHTLAAFAYRGGRAFIANEIYHFVPAGGPVTVTRDIAPTATCNSCHNPLAFHGGTRLEVGLCVMCHTDQSTDPESGESVVMNEMIHKIHNGADLTNPYFIVGHNQGVHEYNDIHFPMAVQNCTKCHTGGADADNWKTAPSRVACGSCHDAVDWVSGAGHNGGPQSDDAGCAGCHSDTMGTEFDMSVPGAHVHPYWNTSNPNLTLAITDVTNMTPGNTPQVTFTVSDDTGPLDIIANPLDYLEVVFAGPTGDYTQIIAGDNRFTIQASFGGAVGTLSAGVAPGEFVYDPPVTFIIDPASGGTWAVGMGGRTPPIDPGNGTPDEFGANNPVVYIDTSLGDLGLGITEPRRQVVDEAATCANCHGDLVMHGNIRTEMEYCVMCHNPWATDEGRRPGVDPVNNPPETITMAHMIHRIHTGHDQEQPYLIWGFSSVHDFSEVHYPGDRADCESCHMTDTWKLPVPATAEATVINIAGATVPQLFAIRPPTGSACTGCHDSISTFAHAELNTIISDEWTWAESCTVCHGEDKEYDVQAVHGN